MCQKRRKISSLPGGRSALQRRQFVNVCSSVSRSLTKKGSSRPTSRVSQSTCERRASAESSWKKSGTVDCSTTMFLLFHVPDRATRLSTLREYESTRTRGPIHDQVTILTSSGRVP